MTGVGRRGMACCVMGRCDIECGEGGGESEEVEEEDEGEGEEEGEEERASKMN